MKRSMIPWLFLFFILFLIPSISLADEGEGEDDQNDGDDQPSAEEMQKKIAELERRIKEIEARQRQTEPANRDRLEWEKDREGFTLSNGWHVAFHGEFRSRALVEANTVNGYTNAAGERIYAYNPKSTLSNDYGWWDMRLQMRTLFNFGDTADLIMTMQLGDIVWGSNSPVVGARYTDRTETGGVGTAKYDQVDLFFRELYTRIDLDPIPMFLVFGRMPVELGNRLIMGNEHDGAYTYFGPKWLQGGFGAVRQYEGENYEMQMRWNDDEDTFFAWINSDFARQHLSVFGWVADWKVADYPNIVAPNSPLWLLPNFSQENNASQESQQWNIGGQWAGRFGPVGINAEYDHQFGKILANDDTPGAIDIDFKGFAAFLKADWYITNLDRLALTAGYGSGDDPTTPEYEGFFAPDNDMGIKEETAQESIDRGYFSVYEALSPGAGVPGRLKDNLGSGGLENTIFANLGLDLGFQANHRYYVSWGYIRAAEPNPETDDAEIGWEMDARVDYLFANNVTFSVYGGHLFMTGEYFRRDAHDAAQIDFEWKIEW